MAANTIHVSISAETLFSIGGVSISNSMLTSVLVSAFIIGLALVINLNLKKTNKPSGLQNIAEFIIEGLYTMVADVAGSQKKTRSFFPLIATFFLFILFQNYAGLLPGMGTVGILEKVEDSHNEVVVEEHSLTIMPQVLAAETANDHGVVTEDSHQVEATATTEEKGEHRGPKFVPIFRAGTADLNTTLALALVSVIATQAWGIKFQGIKYFSKFINFSSPINAFVGILEIISEFAKIISFAFRLFGNIFAGEVLLVVIGALIPIIAPMPFYGLELFVGFIQALVFAMLSLVFFNMATIGHSDH